MSVLDGVVRFLSDGSSVFLSRSNSAREQADAVASLHRIAREAACTREKEMQTHSSPIGHLAL